MRFYHRVAFLNDLSLLQLLELNSVPYLSRKIKFMRIKLSRECYCDHFI